MSFVTCPYCGSSNIFYTHAERKFECRKCGKAWYKKEEEKELPLKRTLEPFVEAARVKPLDTFKGTTFYFETREDRQRAYELLARHDFHLSYGPDFSLTDIADPDYMLELLALEGFDTARILVERS